MKHAIASILCIALNIALAQPQPIKTIDLAGIKQVAIDRAGDFYATTAAAIVKFDKDGERIATHTTSRSTTLFDPGNGVRLLAYYRDIQAYDILTPALQQKINARLDPAFAIEPWLICSSGDYNLWILDAADWSVKNVDTRRSVVSQEFSLDSVLQANPRFTFMRAYQGYLFLLDEEAGIVVLNRLGMIVRTLPVPHLPSFGFLGQELYYYREGSICFTDLFTGKSRSEPFDYPCSEILLSDERCIAIGKASITVFSYTPPKTSAGER